MATIYVRSTDGSDADNGSSWLLAKATLAGAIAVAVAGDTIYLASTHSESTAAAVTYDFPGTLGNPLKLLSVSDAAEPPTTLLAGATIATTGASNLITTGFIYCDGVRFLCGDGANLAQIILGNTTNNFQKYRNCHFELRNTNAGAHLYPVNANSGAGAYGAWEDCTFSFGSDGQRLRFLNGRFYYNGGGPLVIPASTTTLMEPGVNVSTHYTELSNLDLSTIPSFCNLMAATGVGITRISNCKMPTSWSGSIVSGVKAAGSRTELFNSDSGDTNYLTWIEDGYGRVRNDSGIYLTGTAGIKHNGANVPQSYKLAAEATAAYPFGLLAGMWVILVNEVLTAQTATLEIIHNEVAALNDDEAWLELDYPASAASTKFSRLTDAKAGIMASAAVQAASTADWDDGLTERANSTAYVAGNLIKSSGSAGSAFICTVSGTSAASAPGGYTAAADGATITDGTATFMAMRRQKLAVTFTAAEQGVIRARPVLAKASAVVWAAAKITLV